CQQPALYRITPPAALIPSRRLQLRQAGVDAVSVLFGGIDAWIHAPVHREQPGRKVLQKTVKYLFDALVEAQDAPLDKPGATAESFVDQALELGAVGKPRQDRRHHDAGVDPGLHEPG